MPYERDPMVKVFSLWETRKKRDDGNEIRFWSGNSGGVRYLMFRSKSTHPQAPMFDVFVTKSRPKPKNDSGDRNSPSDQEDYGTQAQEKPKDAPAANPGDDELPF